MADVAATLAAWSSTTNSNSPSGTTAVSTGLDDNLRELQGVIVRGLSHKGSDIASATTTDLGAVEGIAHDITGVTTITAFGTVRAGIWKMLKYEGALTLTHNATSLILLPGANRTTANGDTQIVMSEGSGNWREYAYFTAADTVALLAATQTFTNKTLTAPTLTSPVINTAVTGSAVATQANMETGTATDLVVTPGRQHFHPGAAKAWGTFEGPTNRASFPAGATSTAPGLGVYVVTHGRTFSSVYYAVVLTILDSTGNALPVKLKAQTTTTFTVQVYDPVDSGDIGTNYDSFLHYVCYGDL